MSGVGEKLTLLLFRSLFSSLGCQHMKLCFFTASDVRVYADLQAGHVSPVHPSMPKAAKPFLCFISLIWVQRVFLKLVNNVNTCPFRE